MSVTIAATYWAKATEDKIAPYERALREADIESVRNPKSLEGLDGLLLTGGSDVNPVHYGQKRLRESDKPDYERDDRELRLLREALEADLPVFGICRGLQLMNVFCGGTLIQHLPASPLHRQRPKNSENGHHPAAHTITVEPGTILASIIGSGRHEVNSRHHQAVDSLGKGLVVSATSEDGVIEGLEFPQATFAVAVQWHPEDRIFVSELDRKLFGAFKAALITAQDERHAVRLPSS